MSSSTKMVQRLYKIINRLFIKKSVYEVYSIFYLNSKIFGLGTFKFKDGQFKNCLFGILLFAFSCFLTTFYFLKQQTTFFTFSKVLSRGMYYVDRLPTFGMLFFIFFNFRNRKNLHLIFQKLQNFDKKVNAFFKFKFILIFQLQIEPLVKQKHTKHFLILFTFVLLKYVFTVIEFSTVKTVNWWEVTRTSFCNGMFIFNQLPGFALIYLAYDRFRSFNEFIRISKAVNGELKLKLSLAHQLFDIVDLIGKTCGAQIFASLLVNWISGIFASFAGFEVIVLGNHKYHNTLITLVVYNSLDIIDFFVVCWLMNSMKNQVRIVCYFRTLSST